MSVRRTLNEEIFSIDCGMKRAKSKTSRCCPIQAFLEIVSSKWDWFILCRLMNVKKSGFNDLKKSLGICEKMLSQRLERLRRRGIIEKKKIPSKRTIHGSQYSLTPLGEKLESIMEKMAADWMKEYKEPGNRKIKKEEPEKTPRKKD